MSSLVERPATAPTALADVTARQLAGIDAFHRLRRAAALDAAAAGSREDGMDAARRREVLERERQALVDRTDEQLRRAGGSLARTPLTALVAHRHAWFAEKVTALLQERGLDVLGRTDVGADAVGWAVAEQPSVVLVDDTLAMLPGDQVVRELRALCPETVVAAQVDHADRVGRMLEAGATTVHVRAVPPGQVADDVVALLAQRDRLPAVPDQPGRR